MAVFMAGTMTTTRPGSRQKCGHACAARAADSRCAGASGTVTGKRLPAPGSLSSHSLPPIAATRWLVSARAKADPAGAAGARASEPVATLFRITCMDKVFVLYATEDEATQAMSQRQERGNMEEDETDEERRAKRSFGQAAAAKAAAWSRAKSARPRGGRPITRGKSRVTKSPQPLP